LSRKRRTIWNLGNSQVRRSAPSKKFARQGGSPGEVDLNEAKGQNETKVERDGVTSNARQTSTKWGGGLTAREKKKTDLRLEKLDAILRNTKRKVSKGRKNQGGEGTLSSILGHRRVRSKI